MNVVSDDAVAAGTARMLSLGGKWNFFTYSKNRCTLLGENIALFLLIENSGMFQRLHTEADFPEGQTCPLSTYCLRSRYSFPCCSAIMELGPGSTEQGVFCPFLNIASFIINLTVRSFYVKLSLKSLCGVCLPIEPQLLIQGGKTKQARGCECARVRARVHVHVCTCACVYGGLRS